MGCEGLVQYCSDSTQRYIDLLTHDYCVRKTVENYTLNPFLETCIRNKELQMRNYITQVEHRKGNRHIEVDRKSSLTVHSFPSTMKHMEKISYYFLEHSNEKKKRERERSIIFFPCCLFILFFNINLFILIEG